MLSYHEIDSRRPTQLVEPPSPVPVPYDSRYVLTHDAERDGTQESETEADRLFLACRFTLWPRMETMDGESGGGGCGKDELLSEDVTGEWLESIRFCLFS